MRKYSEQQILDLCDRVEQRARRSQSRVYNARHEQREYRELREYRDGQRAARDNAGYSLREF